MKEKSEGFSPVVYLILTAVVAAVFLLCVCAGSVSVPVADTLRSILSGLGLPAGELEGGVSRNIILYVRLPRVICTALVGASLSLCGGAMQGLLRNPLADGSTLGVSSGASLGAVLAIATGFRIPGFPGGGTMVLAMVFAFLSLLFILTLAYRLDYSLATNTIILVGVVFSMFSTSMISLIVTFAGEKVKTIMFWTMGSLAGSNYMNVATMLVALAVCGFLILRCCRELNAFALGEENARHIGIDVRRVKLIVLIAVSALIGICVSIGGTISFVGLVIPHITRMVTGPNHRRLLPASLFLGAVFLMLADLVGRTVFRPIELPIGVVTSIIGSVVFIWIFYATRKVR